MILDARVVNRWLEECGRIDPLYPTVCLNVNCTVAQDTATAEAARDTAKATAKARPTPRAVNIRGNVD